MLNFKLSVNIADDDIDINKKIHSNFIIDSSFFKLLIWIFQSVKVSLHIFNCLWSILTNNTVCMYFSYENNEQRKISYMYIIYMQVIIIIVSFSVCSLMIVSSCIWMQLHWYFYDIHKKNIFCLNDNVKKCNDRKLKQVNLYFATINFSYVQNVRNFII